MQGQIKLVYNYYMYSLSYVIDSNINNILNSVKLYLLKQITLTT